MNWGAVYRRVISEGGFDPSAANTPLAQIQEWCHERYSELVVESKWREALQNLGNTVAGQASYAVDSTVVERIIAVYVGQGGREYGAVGPRDLIGLVSGDLRLADGVAGVYSPDYDSAGGTFVKLFGVPATTGDPINALVALEPVRLGTVAGDADVPIIPSEYHVAICQGATANGLLFLDERPDLAQGFEAKFEAAKLKLTRRKNNRFRDGPVQIKVQGFHFA